MAWNRCCGTPCKVVRYPISLNSTDVTMYQAESKFYHALNTARGFDSYDPLTDTHYQMDLSAIGVLILGNYGNQLCQWVMPHFGMSEFVTFLNRGKTIILTGEWRDCFSGLYNLPGTRSGMSIQTEIAAALSCTMTWNNPDVYKYGCQTMQNYAPKNNLNIKVDSFPIGGSNTIAVPTTATPLVQGATFDAYTGQMRLDASVVAAQVVNANNGKVVLLADENMFDCGNQTGLNQLMLNLCKGNGKPIAAI